MWVEYVGELIDLDNRPISGVFPMAFRIFRSPAAADPVWEEEQFVAVFEGRYTVLLGRNNGVPGAYRGLTRTLGVTLGELGEVSRHAVVLREYIPESATPLPTISRQSSVGLAGQAIRADRATIARHCERLGGQTSEQLDHYQELRDQLQELSDRINRPAGNRIGPDTVVLTRIGGIGGNRYHRSCPPGFVVSGARGGGGNLIDGFRPICTQLE